MKISSQGAGVSLILFNVSLTPSVAVSASVARLVKNNKKFQKLSLSSFCLKITPHE